MRTALLKWRHSLPWVLFACLVLGCVMAVYTWAYEADRYEAVYTFYAMPDLAGTQRAAPGGLAHAGAGLPAP